MSAKRAAQLVERREMVAKVLAERPRCEFPVSEKCRVEERACNGYRCPNRSTDVHELLSRGRGGSFLEKANTIAICRQHHDWAHNHPVLAAEIGLLRPSWDR